MVVHTSGREGFGLVRFFMVLSSVSPLFILWAIRGDAAIPSPYFTWLCIGMVVVPNGVLLLRLVVAKRRRDVREIVVGSADDHRDHILVYLFAMLLPFYSEGLGLYREFAATLAALSFIVFLFWHLNLHYMNILFAVLDYRVFTVSPPDDGNQITHKQPVVLLARRIRLVEGQKLKAYRLSNSVYLEVW